MAPVHTTPHSQIRHAVTEGIHVVEQFIFHYLQGLNSIILTTESTKNYTLPKGLAKVTEQRAKSFIHLLVWKLT